MLNLNLLDEGKCIFSVLDGIEYIENLVAPSCDKAYVVTYLAEWRLTISVKVK
jgi:hypothetical protein